MPAQLIGATLAPATVVERPAHRLPGGFALVRIRLVLSIGILGCNSLILGCSIGNFGRVRFFVISFSMVRLVIRYVAG